MKVTIEFIGRLKKFDKNFNNQKNIEIEIFEAAKVTNALDFLNIPNKYVSIVTINGNKSNMETNLKEGDFVKLYPIIVAG